MPSPFPGMDPYLEGGLWTTVQSQLAVEIVRQLVPKVRPHYLALNTEGVIAAVAHVNVEIRDRAKRGLVTAIQLISPTIKSHGRVEYLVWREELMKSTVHLLEIDLLRQGHRVPIQWNTAPKAPYYVFRSRGLDRQIVEVWPITLQDRLPFVHVSLLPTDADVALDLQQAFTNVYDLCGYDLAVDYTQPPDVPLPPDADNWADSLLRAAGLRS